MLVVNGVVMITKEFIGLVGSIVGMVLCVIGVVESGLCLWNDSKNMREKEERNERNEKS